MSIQRKFTEMCSRFYLKNRETCRCIQQSLYYSPTLSLIDRYSFHKVFTSQNFVTLEHPTKLYTRSKINR